MSKGYNAKNRQKLLLIFYLFFSLIIAYRYFYLQVIQNEYYEVKAGNNSLRKIIKYPPRGIIYDRNYEPLVDNQSLYEVKIIPHDINSNFNYKLVNRHLNINKAYIDSVINKSQKILGGQFKPMLLKRNIDFKTKSILEESKLDLVGMYFIESPARTYTSRCNLSHTIGYLGQIDQKTLSNSKYYISDVIGYSGIEEQYELDLRGKYGVEYFFVDRFGIIQSEYNSDKNLLPIQGNNISLTIDAKLQYYIESLIKEYKASVIVMNPINGEILSLSNSPTFDLNSFVGSISNQEWNQLKTDEDKPFTNRAMQQTYPPGSIFKLLLAAMALENNLVDDNWKVNCEGEYKFFDSIFRCWKEDGHGEVNLKQAIKGSCNIYFYNLMQNLSFNLWHDEALKFGFGKITDIDLPNEKTGIVPNKDYMNKKYRESGGWSKGHLLNLSIGQGEVTATPLQIIQLINLIATNGNTKAPHLNLQKPQSSILVNYDDFVWTYLQESMFDVVNKAGGTGYNARLNTDNVLVYGKTGTAQVCSNCDIDPHGWFAGYIALPNKKKYSICIIIENGGKGSDIPTILARNIFNFIVLKERDI